MYNKARNGRIVAAFVGVCIVVAGHTSFAQEKSGLEEVVVTAQKRSQNLQSVPIAATALTAEALETRFIKGFTDISAALPNASLEGEGLSNYASSFYIRGQGTQNRGPFVDPAVSVSVDGIAGGYVATALTDFQDIEAIEVLRGPQGTLQGRNSTGGAILVRHKRPNVNDVEGNFGVLVGNDGRRDVSAVANLPINSGTSAFRVAAKLTQTDGFFTNSATGKKVSGQDRVAVLPSFLVSGDSWDATLRGTYNRYRDDSSTLIPRYACRVDPRIDANSAQNDTYVRAVALRLGGAAALKFCAHEPTSADFTVNQNRPIEGANLDQTGITLETNYRIGDAGTVTFIANRQNNEETSALDVDGTMLQLNSNQENTKHHQKSAELRYASNASGPFTFVAGAFWLDQGYNLTRTTKADAGAASLVPNVLTLFGGSKQNNRQSGVFAQGEYKFSDSLTGVAGARYTKDKKDILVCGAAASACETRAQFNKASWSDTSPRVGLNWQVDTDTYLYGFWAKGFRAGGFNGEAGTASAAGPFAPEEVKTIELGAKVDLLDRRARLNFAIFDTKASDLQRQLSRATASGVAEIVTQNAAAASFKGAELEATFLLSDAFRVEATIGYLDAKYTDYCKDLNGAGANDPSLVACASPITVTGGVIQPVDLTKLPIARAPKTTSRLAALYTVNAVASGSVDLWVEWAHQGTQMTLDGGAPVGTTLGITNFDGSRINPIRPATNVINASATWKSSDDRYRVGVYGKNLTNELWFRRLSFASPTLSFGTLADPREYGISVQYNFGK